MGGTASSGAGGAGGGEPGGGTCPTAFVADDGFTAGGGGAVDEEVDEEGSVEAKRARGRRARSARSFRLGIGADEVDRRAAYAKLAAKWFGTCAATGLSESCDPLMKKKPHA